MIQNLRIKGFKNFQDVELELGPMNLFVGANASGKSNLLEVLRIFQGIALGYRIDEIFDGKPKSARGDTWEPIRGGLANAGFFGQDLMSFGISGHVTEPLPAPFSYDVSISSHHGSSAEKLSLNDELILDDARLSALGQPALPGIWFGFETPGRAALLRDLLSKLTSTVKFDPSPAILRQYSDSKEVRQMGEHGENFAAVVKRILEDHGHGPAYISWLEQMTPREFDHVKTVPGALGEPMFALEHHGKTFFAPSLSDGTLKFAALAAAFFQPDPPNQMILEEIENGIHPSRLRLLVDIMRQLSDLNAPQVFATTHSPVLLDWLTDEDLKHTFLCTRNEDTGVSSVRSLASVPRFREIIREHPAGELFTEGWMETAV